MRDLNEAFPPSPAAGESSGNQLRMRLLKPLQLPHQLVVLGVRNLRRIEHVVKMLMVRNFLAQRVNLLEEQNSVEVIPKISEYQ